MNNMEEQLYRKEGRRYVPIGYSDGWTGFPTDGIWLVQKKDGCKSSECIIKYEELEVAKPAINLIFGYKDKIVDFINNQTCELRESTNDYVLRMLKDISK